jgi:uncharacterized membrane protein YhaH (DUF805 family)
MHCANCGEKVEEGAKFCAKCGAATDGSHHVPHHSVDTRNSFGIGRLGRLAFFVGIVVAPLIFGIAMYSGMPSVVVDTLALVWLVWLVSIIIGRAHDLGYSAWFSILIILVCGIPVLNAIMLIYLCAAQGSEAANEYGKTPKGSVNELLYFWRVTSAKAI